MEVFIDLIIDNIIVFYLFENDGIYIDIMYFGGVN